MYAMENTQKRPRILIVDDDKFVRTIFQDALERVGYLATAAPDGTSALACLKKTPHDLVLLDLIMPGKDGLDTCQELRTFPLYQHIPVLMITGSGDSELLNRAFDAGATDFVMKPITPELLVHRVRYLLRSNRDMKRLEQSTSRLANAHRIAQLGSWVWDPGKDAFYGSAETCKIMGQGDQASHLSLPEFLYAIDPCDRGQVAVGLQTVHKNGVPCTMEFNLRRPDTTLRVVRLQAYLDETDPYEIPMVTGTIQDLTEIQTVEDRLQMLKEAIDCLPIGTGITISDVNGTIISSNSADAEMHGYASEELIGKHARMLAPKSLE